MKSEGNYVKMSEYVLDDKELITGFNTFSSAEDYAKKHNGTIIEVAFLDANDNPQVSNKGHLVENRMVFYADAGPEYEYLYSDNPKFKAVADKIINKDYTITDKNILDKYFNDDGTALIEDPVIILRNGEYDSITTREQAKYAKGAKVYEIGVLTEYTQKDSN